jgi:hypothetical protein
MLLLDRSHSLGDDGERRAVPQDHRLPGFSFNVEVDIKLHTTKASRA